jgi:hypothetical protein
MKLLSHAVVDNGGDLELFLTRLFANEERRADVRDALFSYRYLEEKGKRRRLYQEITEICQDHDPLCFERELAQRIRSADTSGQFVLIDDVRKLSAFEYFTERGYLSLRIEANRAVRKQRVLSRDGYLPTEEIFNHPSETELDDIPHDFTIENNTNDMKDLYHALAGLVDKIRTPATVPA